MLVDTESYENERDRVEHPARMSTAHSPKIAESAKQVGTADKQPRHQSGPDADTRPNSHSLSQGQCRCRPTRWLGSCRPVPARPSSGDCLAELAPHGSRSGELNHRDVRISTTLRANHDFERIESTSRFEHGFCQRLFSILNEAFSQFRSIAKIVTGVCDRQVRFDRPKK